MAPDLICYADSYKLKSKRINKLWTKAEGLNALRIDNAARRVPDVPAFFYGVTPRQLDLFNRVRAAKDDWYYCDNAYAPSSRINPVSGERQEIFRVTKNAAQIDGTGRSDPVRRDRYMPKIKPWRTGGREVLVCLQSDWHHKVWGGEDWFDQTMDILLLATDRPIIIRDKPLRNPKEKPFLKAMETAHAVVTYNSRVATEAILAGVPAFVGTTCAASPMASGSLWDIESPKRPAGRAEWAAVLAAHQWTTREIRSGKAWRDLNSG